MWLLYVIRLKNKLNGMFLTQKHYLFYTKCTSNPSDVHPFL